MQGLCRYTLLLLLLVPSIHATEATQNLEEKPFVVIVPSYNNAKDYQQNLDTIFSQVYENFRVIYINDASADGTGELVEAYVQEEEVSDQITIIHNEENRGALYNLYHAIHSCDDEEIVVCLDGDDWFADDCVLRRMNELYSSGKVWLTYGGYRDYPGGWEYHGKRYDKERIKKNWFRSKPILGWMPTRTFYAWLFKRIKMQDLMFQGSFYPMAWDWGIMFPMLEMAGERFEAVEDIFYIYNRANPISDNRKDRELQSFLGRLIINKEKYRRLKRKPGKKL